MKLRIIIATLLYSACFQEEEAAQVKSGAAEVRVWYKTPTQIANTAKQSWELRIDSEEEHKYITSLGPFYGGIDKLLMKSTLERPTSGYVLALDVVAAWLSHKLVAQEKDTAGFLFSGGVDTREKPKDNYSCDEYANNYCYEMDSVAWCDCFDKIELGRYDSTTVLTLEDRKRLMHNIQDIGEFLNIPIDDKLYIDAAKSIHAAQYLLDNVFIPNLNSPHRESDQQESETVTDVTESSDYAYEEEEEILASDHEAWVKVVYTIMMSGPVFMNLQMSGG